MIPPLHCGVVHSFWRLVLGMMEVCSFSWFVGYLERSEVGGPAQPLSAKRKGSLIGRLGGVTERCA